VPGSLLEADPPRGLPGRLFTRHDVRGAWEVRRCRTRDGPGCGPVLRGVLPVRRDEFTVAPLAAAAVVTLVVQDGIILAIAASIVDHLTQRWAGVPDREEQLRIDVTARGPGQPVRSSAPGGASSGVQAPGPGHAASTAGLRDGRPRLWNARPSPGPA
jgi:hypothetical protein